MISQKTTDALKTIGLNLYERKIYIALLAKTVGTAGELAELASVPRSRAYDVLESLAEKGFAVVQHAKPIKYVAVEPSIALDKTRDIIKDKYSKNVMRINQFSESDAITELSNLYSNGVSVIEPSDMSGSFKGGYSITMQLNNIIKNTESNILILTTEDGIKDMWKKNMSLLSKAKNRGISIKIAVPFTDSNKKEIEALGNVAEIRDINKLGHKPPVCKMVISDEGQLLLGLTDDSTVHESQQTGFWTQSSHLTKDFAVSMFDMIWGNIE
ncbi:MAG: TrmB family transcriptional regulator [Candidatus Aenigmarchaeota archaeon]|nr:TrmB family transcriptional regulator [Candidatus Aenigmarchaeota archaeon]MCK5373419.1 TrmB family transcriptional regulator [Candidatus Aenigmarchaeota archaeon]MCK5452201.1 TrmB family transcriptional regulator [Candidatus Aenigmarchaeota archaeon]